MAYLETPCVHENTRYAMEWLQMWLQFMYDCGTTGCVVFDIDDTLLFSATHSLNLPVFRVYQVCRKLGFACCIVTARPDTPENRKLTLDALKKHGIDGFETLHMMPESLDVTYEGISEYKWTARTQLAASRRILASIGDAWSDLLKFPLSSDARSITDLRRDACAIFFPPDSHGEVAVKLPFWEAHAE